MQSAVILFGAEAVLGEILLETGGRKNPVEKAEEDEKRG